MTDSTLERKRQEKEASAEGAGLIDKAGPESSLREKAGS